MKRFYSRPAPSQCDPSPRFSLEERWCYVLSIGKAKDIGTLESRKLRAQLSRCPDFNTLTLCYAWHLASLPFCPGNDTLHDVHSRSALNNQHFLGMCWAERLKGCLLRMRHAAVAATCNFRAEAAIPCRCWLGDVGILALCT